MSRLKAFAEKRTPLIRILSIDPGTANIALAVIDWSSGAGKSANWESERPVVTTSKIEIPKEIVDHFVKLRYVELAIEQWVVHYRPDLIVKEGVAYGTTFGVAASGEVQYAVERLAMERGIPCLTVANSQMRSFMGAKEKGATKSDVKLRVYQRFWNFEFPSEDETDAFAVGMTGHAMIFGTYTKGKSKK